jgi:two-component system, chemotaxis family, protein-glutamate methylesterase/glutaminase
MAKPPYKVLVVDDSPLFRHAIVDIVSSSDELLVVGQAASGKEALAMIPKLKPDLVTLDIIMPEMNGLTTLKYIMIFHPVPTIMLSSLAQEGADITFDALRYGAIDFIAKPSKLGNESLKDQALQIMQKMRIAAKVKVSAIQYIRVKPKSSTQIIELQKKNCKNIVVLGVAEGGYGTLLKILLRLKPYPGTVYMVIFYETSQHVDGFIKYLNQYTAVKVQRPLNNTLLEAGVCYISSGEEYVTVHKQHGSLVSYVSPAPFSTRRGTIDMLMFSVADTVGKHSLGVILSGEGKDGSEGLEEIVRVGGGAMIQAPVSCLYRSMALSALNMCEAEVVVADSEIAAEITKFLPKLNF